MKKLLVVTKNIDPTSIIYGKQGVTDVTGFSKGMIRALKEKNLFLTEVVEVIFPELSHPFLMKRAIEIDTEICDLQKQIIELEREKKKLP